jgi:lipopolysaccharide/colanic/teichoic acid biosynthesis glycosyltransferase
MTVTNNYLKIRGIADRIVALLGFIILLPVFCVLSVLIRINMGSPVFFRQIRVGQYGKEFQILKFRTMVHKAEQLGGGYMPPELNLIPPLGKFLRNTSLDEIPQLINIIRGDMSLVGPRPALPDQYRRYSSEQARRVEVPQGITGLAQIRFRNNATWSVRIQSDLEYVEKLGLRLDLLILFKTLKKVVRSGDVRHDQAISEVDDLG